MLLSQKENNNHTSLKKLQSKTKYNPHTNSMDVYVFVYKLLLICICIYKLLLPLKFVIKIMFNSFVV